ncbi:MAG TPA: transposase [Candidatus Methylacidiphilales bacterium]|jgi:putative transposase|nr:transposase [Candidatus Methylacidiphilales bacterium]
MPRRKVFDYPGAVHFVTFSTHQRRRFLEPDRSKEIVLETLESFFTSHGTVCTGFVVMPNHVHAILSGGPEFQISKFVQVWKKTSSYRIRQFYREYMERYRALCPEECPIWQASFYDANLESDEKVNEALEYMHQNPVTAGLCDHSVDWLWSSARFYEEGRGVGVTVTP